MQLCSTQSKLLWLLLPALATALTPPVGDSISDGTDQLHLLTLPQESNTSFTNQQSNTTFPNLIAHCRNDPYPYPFVTSLNYTFPITPPIPQDFIASSGLDPGEGDYPFDCFIEIPGGIVAFEVCTVPPRD